MSESNALFAPPLTMLGCVSHSPLIAIRPRAPVQEPDILAHCEQFRQNFDAFKPERIVFFTNNHFAGFHFANMPAYCVGTQCQAVDDLGGTPGPIPVPADEAIALVEHLRDEGFDPAISYKMQADHAISQPLMRLIGALDEVPLIPVFISCFTPPLMRFGRSRRLGEAVGRWIEKSGRRTLVMGSGGISHHPVRYFPLMGTADDRVYGYQLEGERGGTMTDEQWFNRFSEMHTEGAQMVLDGRRTAKDMRFNEAFDAEFLQRYCAGDLASMDDWEPNGLIEMAGVGTMELHMWIAAMAAHLAAGGKADEASLERYYAQTPEYGTAYSTVYSKPQTRA